MTLTEEQYYLNLHDYMSNGKCCRWTAAPTDLPGMSCQCVDRTG
jgi:hypothetical protein